MKFAFVLALLPLLLLAQDNARIQELIRNLDDDSFDVRDAAERALIEIGPPAIPSLMAVIAGAERDREKTELKIRAMSALRGIEFAVKAKQYYVEPKLVTLHARDSDVGQVLADLEKQTGVRIHAGSTNPKAKVTLDAENAPLFQVLDHLCRGQEERTYEVREDGVRFSKARFVECPSAYEGPFRFRIVRLQHEQSTDFKTREGQVELALEVDWQRSLKPSRRVDVAIRAATDDKGANLEAMKFGSGEDGEDVGGPGPNARWLLKQAGKAAGADDANALPVQVFTFKGLRSGAARISFRGQARFRFPLEKRDLLFDKPSAGEPLQEGGLSFSLQSQGASRFWKLTLTPVQGQATLGPEDIDGCIDRDSFVALDDAGKEHTAVVHPSEADPLRRARGGQVPVGTPLAVYQVAFPTLEDRAPKSIRFKVLSQIFVKTVSFAFNDVPLP